MNNKTFAILALALALVPGFDAAAGSLENLERERAILVETMLAPDMPAQQRAEKIAQSRTRLVDLERMVLRDGSLAGKATPVVRSAFENYDLTFLVHAATEKNLAMADHWLEQIGLTTNALMSARVGRR